MHTHQISPRPNARKQALGVRNTGHAEETARNETSVAFGGLWVRWV